MVSPTIEAQSAPRCHAAVLKVGIRFRNPIVLAGEMGE
jgi:hypothetical protein